MSGNKPIPSLKRAVVVPPSVMENFVNAGTVTPPAPLTLVPDAAAVSAAPVAKAEVAPAVVATLAPVEAPAPVAAERSSRPSKKSGRKLEVRKDGTEARKVTFYLDPEVDRALAVHAATSGMDRSMLVNEALAKFLKRRSE